jgi:hypothetical protein
MFKIEIKSNDVLTNYAEFTTEDLCNEWYEENKEVFPIGHTKQIFSLFDIQQETKRQIESKEAIELGTSIIIQIRAINRRKLKTGLWDQTKFNSLLVNSTAAQIERALWNGSLTTAAYLLTGMSAFYSDIEITKIVDQITAHETKWSELI